MTHDIEIIREILEGNIESFRLVLERYQKPIIRMIRDITGNKEYCEDIAQDVFLAAYKKLASFDPARSNFSTWLFTIARNKSINALKKKRIPSMNEPPQEVDTANPSDDMAQKEFFDQLDHALQTLPTKQKTAFVLAELEKLPYEQISQIEGVRVGTVKSRINRAKKKLKSALIGFEEEGS